MTASPYFTNLNKARGVEEGSGHRDRSKFESLQGFLILHR